MQWQERWLNVCFMAWTGVVTKHCLERSAFVGQSGDLTAVVSPGCQDDAVPGSIYWHWHWQRVFVVNCVKCPCNIFNVKCHYNLCFHNNNNNISHPTGSSHHVNCLFDYKRKKMVISLSRFVFIFCWQQFLMSCARCNQLSFGPLVAKILHRYRDCSLLWSRAVVVLWRTMRTLCVPLAKRKQSRCVYVAGCRPSCVLRTVVRQCDGRRRCSIDASASAFNNRCLPGATKFLAILHTCGPYTHLLCPEW